MALNIAPNDVSIGVLNLILGQGWTSWMTGSNPQGAGGILGSMFGEINTALMGIAAFVLVYTHVHGSAEMARTGQAKHNTWTFMRQSLAMMLLAPVPWASGFSVLQVLVLGVTTLGVGLADDAWNTGVAYVSQNGGTVQPPSNIPGLQISDQTLAGVAKMAVIAEMMSQSGGYTVQPFTAPTYGFSATGAQTGVVGGYQATNAGISPQTMGTWSATCDPALCAGVQAGMSAVFADMLPLATAAVSWTTPGQDGLSNPQAGLYAKARADYAQAVLQAYSQNVSAAGSAFGQAINEFGGWAPTFGWITAGTYFYRLSDLNNTAASLRAQVSFQPANMTTLDGEIPASVNDAIRRIDDFTAGEESAELIHTPTSGVVSGVLASAGASALPGGQCPSTSFGDAISCWISAPALAVDAAIIRDMTGGGAPWSQNMTPGGVTGINTITGIQTDANVGIDTIEAAATAYAGAKAVAAYSDSLAQSEERSAQSVPMFGSVLGAVGGVAAAAPAAAKASLAALSGPFWTAIYITFAACAVGAYYLPMLPAIVYTIAAAGWIIMVLEMLVAAPIWAFSHVLPGGEGLMGSSSRAGYFHLLDVLARPVLLVLGLFLTILTMGALIWFAGTSLQIAFAAEEQGKIVGAVSAIAELAIVMGVVFFIVNKCVHLISSVPRTVMRWMGQSMGVDFGGEGEAHRSLVAVGGRLGGAAQQIRNEVGRGGGGGAAHPMPTNPAGGKSSSAGLDSSSQHPTT